MKKVNTSGLSFRDIREGGKYYVDKSLLIKDMLDTDDRGVFLYTRPRRFGKTTNLTMLDAFFNIEYKGNTWFDGLAISEHPDCMCQMSRYPVILLDLKDLAAEGNNDYGIFVSRVKKVLEALPQVDEAVVSHEQGTAVVTLNAETADEVLKKAVEDQDYKVTGIE